MSTVQVSELGLIPALPPEAPAPPKGPVSGATRLGGPRPAGPADTADNPSGGAGAADPFAALLQGFLASAQQGASPDAPAADGPLTDLPPGPDAGAAAPILIASVPPGTAPGGLPDATTTALPGEWLRGRYLPSAGKTLPPELAGPGPGIPATALPQGSAADADAAVAGPAPDAVPEKSFIRVSLADLEAARSIRTASVDPGALATLSDVPDPGALAFGDILGDGPATGGDRPEKLAPIPLQSAADFPRLALGLPVNGDRDLAAALRTGVADAIAGRDTASFQTASQAASLSTDTSGGLRGLLNGSLAGFPPLQPLGQPGAWADGLGDRLLTLAGPGTHSAKLTLHPDSLGTLDVEIRIDDGNAQVWFGSSHAQTRDAIEGSLPRLREMFADQGITLTRTHVDTGQERRPPEAPPERPKPTPWDRAPDRRLSVATLLAPASLVTPAGTRLLDVWA